MDDLFRRVVDRDYEPAEWDGYRFRAYGAFVRERLGYAKPGETVVRFESVATNAPPRPAGR